MHMSKRLTMYVTIGFCVENTFMLANRITSGLNPHFIHKMSIFYEHCNERCSTVVHKCSEICDSDISLWLRKKILWNVDVSHLNAGDVENCYNNKLSLPYIIYDIHFRIGKLKAGGCTRIGCPGGRSVYRCFFIIFERKSCSNVYIIYSFQCNFVVFERNTTNVLMNDDSACIFLYSVNCSNKHKPAA